MNHNSADTAFDTYRSCSYFGSLDGLRFLCISAVIFHHSELPKQLGSILAQRGFLGVDFFFVISGFLITTLLLRERDRKGTFSLKGFYTRRMLRILPPYFLVITVVGAYYVFVKSSQEAAEIWIYYYLFLANFLTSDIPTLSPTWSLSVEEQYYLLWPLLLLVTPRRFIPTILIALIALNVAISAGAFSFLGWEPWRTEHLVFKLPNSTYAPILIGTLLAIALNHRQAFTTLYKAVGHKAAPVVSAIALIIIVMLVPKDLRGIPNLLIHLIMAAFLASVVIREDNILRSPLTLAPVKRIGEISYGIYLYHLIALDIVNRIGFGPLSDSPTFVLLAYYLVSIILAEISFRFYESWFLRLRHKSS